MYRTGGRQVNGKRGGRAPLPGPGVVYLCPTVPDAHRLERRLIRAAGEAVRDFDLIEGGDRILVAVSGGKDSYTLLHVLMRPRGRAPVRVDLVAVDPGPGEPGLPAAGGGGHLPGGGGPRGGDGRRRARRARG